MTLLSEAELFALGFNPATDLSGVKKLIDMKENTGELKTKDDAKKFLKSEKIIWW